MKLRAKNEWEPETRTFFRDVISIYEVDEAHRSLFMGTCENLDRFYRCHKKLKVEGETFSTKTGQVKKHPLCQVLKDSWSGFLMGLKGLGLLHMQKTGRPPGG